MKLQVLVLPRAKLQIYENALWWAKSRSRDQASEWLEAIEAAINRLADHPEIHPLATESSEFDFELRQMNFGLSGKRTHRVLYSVRESKIVVYAVRHLAQQAVTIDDVL